MHAVKFYRHLYRLLEQSTPIGTDCGALCGAACCQGDADSGMYLFPFEEQMYNGTENWMQIKDSDWFFEGKPVKILICTGRCDRRKRPLSCRIFPLMWYRGALCADPRAIPLCPLAAGASWKDYDPAFLQNVRRVFRALQKVRVTRAYVQATGLLIDELEQLKNQLKKERHD